jgi:hypothetical protein
VKSPFYLIFLTFDAEPNQTIATVRNINEDRTVFSFFNNGNAPQASS